MYGPADHAVNYDSNKLEQVKGQEGSGKPQLLDRREHVARMWICNQDVNRSSAMSYH